MNDVDLVGIEMTPYQALTLAKLLPDGPLGERLLAYVWAHLNYGPEAWKVIPMVLCEDEGRQMIDFIFALPERPVQSQEQALLDVIEKLTKALLKKSVG